MNDKNVAQAIGNMISTSKGVSSAVSELISQQKQDAPHESTKNNNQDS